MAKLTQLSYKYMVFRVDLKGRSSLFRGHMNAPSHSDKKRNFKIS